MSGVPSSIAKSGNQAKLFKYLQQMKAQMQWKIIKLMVVFCFTVISILYCKLGTEGVGKTSLVRTFQGKAFMDTLSTDGINVSDVDISRDFTFRTFDCGGQVNFLPSNQLFVTQEAVLIRCWY